jgi:hypothetical protein
MKGKVVMKLEGIMAEVILKINPGKHKKYVIAENGRTSYTAYYSRRPYTAPFKQHYYFGKTYPHN